MRRRTAALVVAIVVLVGCGSNDEERAAPAADAASTTDPEAGTEGTGADDTPTTDADEAPGADELPLPTTAEEMIAALDEAELALRQPELDHVTAAPWGRRQQALYRVLAFNPDWADDVIGGVDPSVRDAVALNWTATEALVSLVNSHTISDTLPAWRIVAPPPASELVGHYRDAESETGVPWSILAAINLIETRMGRIEGVSTAGAVGPMQFLPTTWAECCEGDPTVPRDAILGAGHYLVQRGADRDLDRAIFGYNNSDDYVTAVTSIAAVLDAEPELYLGYHAWEVYFLSTEGVVVLPEGYEQTEPVPAVEWLRDHPETRFPSP